MEVIIILLAVCFVLWLEARIYRNSALRGIHYGISISKNEAFEGEEIEIIEEIENRKSLPMPWLKTEISTSRWLGFKGTKARGEIENRFVPSIFMLKGYQKCTRKWRVKCLKRGIFRLEDATLLACDIFGLVTVSKRVEVNASIRVLPRPFAVAEAELSKTRFFGENIVRRFICEDPFLISGAREYTGREPLRSVHWASTAKRHELMVYNHEMSAQNTVLVAVNFSRGEAAEIPAHQNDAELFIKIAAFILEKCREKEVNFALITNAENVESFSGANFMPLFAPKNAGICRAEILRRLAGLNAVPRKTGLNILLENNAEYFKKFGITDILIITPYIGESLGKTALRLNRNGFKTAFYCNRCETEEARRYSALFSGNYDYLSSLKEFSSAD